MNNLLRPLVEEFQLLWTGMKLQVSEQHAVEVRAALLALTCDLPAARKVAGFGSHSANLFCSFCYLHRKQMDSVDAQSWEKRTLHQYCVEATAWKEAQTLTAKHDHFARTGVRWTVLNTLPYWNPFKSMSIDIMHNLSGILEYHTRGLIGLDFEEAKTRVPARKPSTESIDFSDAANMTELHEELQALAVEAAEAAEADTLMFSATTPMTEDVDMDIDTVAQTSIPSVHDQLLEIDDDADADYTEPVDFSPSFLSLAQIQQIRHAIAATVVPGNGESLSTRFIMERMRRCIRS